MAKTLQLSSPQLSLLKAVVTGAHQCVPHTLPGHVGSDWYPAPSGYRVDVVTALVKKGLVEHTHINICPYVRATAAGRAYHAELIAKS